MAPGQVASGILPVVGTSSVGGGGVGEVDGARWSEVRGSGSIVLEGCGEGSGTASFLGGEVVLTSEQRSRVASLYMGVEEEEEGRVGPLGAEASRSDAADMVDHQIQLLLEGIHLQVPRPRALAAE